MRRASGGGADPCDAPDCAFVTVEARLAGCRVNCKRRAKRGEQSIPTQRLRKLVVFPFDFEDFDGLVRGAGSETAAVIVQLGIMLEEGQ